MQLYLCIVIYERERQREREREREIQVILILHYLCRVFRIIALYIYCTYMNTVYTLLYLAQIISQLNN